MKMNVPTLSGLLVLALLAGSCGKKTVEPAAPTTGSFAIEMEQVVGADPLILGTYPYATTNGQAFSVSKFEFVVSGLTLRRADGTTYLVPDGYYVVDASKPASSHFIINNVPLGEYTGLSFAVGIDAAHNNNTFESGDLSHTSDLYLGGSYSFMRLAGTSPLSPAGQSLSFTTGGASCLRTVSPAFGTSILTLKTGHIPEVHMSVNVQGMFAGTVPANTVNFSTTTDVSPSGTWAPLIADNYAAGMFALEHIHAN